MVQCSVVVRPQSGLLRHQNFDRIIFYKGDLDIEFNSVLGASKATGIIIIYVVSEVRGGE